MRETIQSYYDRIAAAYDQDRFANSYGAFLHRQECLFLDRFLPENPTGKVLDMGCGTGRWMNRATDGLDFSANMLDIAKLKHPTKSFKCASITETGYAHQSFQAILCMHVLMHLDAASTEQFFQEAARLLSPGGLLVFDFPNLRRRNLLSKNREGWHGSNALDLNQIASFQEQNWQVLVSQGLLFFPIHRIPNSIRPAFLGLDNWLCSTRLNHLASYSIVALQKRCA